MKVDRSGVIEETCLQIANGDLMGATDVLKTGYPFIPAKKSRRSYTPRQMTKVFLRDGFIDRYKGARLVYPPVLRVLSHYLPAAFPYHRNWKMDSSHVAYWELCPTIDHIEPVAVGGDDTEDNWVCCSMLTNTIKANWTLEQLGWELLKPGELKNWDGLIYWFVEQVDKDCDLLNTPYIKTWFSTAKASE